MFDQVIFTADEFELSGDKVGRQVGNLVGHCVVMTPIKFDPPPGSGEFLCRDSHVLDRGQILLSEQVRVADFYGEFWSAVVGGTGAYRDAGGHAFIKSLSEKEGDVTIYLE